MKILFAIHDLRYADQLGLAAIAGIAKAKGHEGYFCTLLPEPFGYMDLFTALELYNPDIVAYSIANTGFSTLCRVQAEAKKRYKFTSILGGPQATFTPETYPQSGVDVYCVGEGEGAFADFLDAVWLEQPIDKIANLITPSGVQPVRRLIPDLDAMPMPDRDLTLRNSILGDEYKKSFMATRGCPMSCYYCANDLFHRLYAFKGPFVRRYSVDRLLGEIEYVKDTYRMEFVKFQDDCFAVNADSWLEDFARKYPSRIGVPFNCYLRIDMVTADMLYLLKKAGCWSVHLSVDSLSSYVREKIFGRRMRATNEEIGRNLEMFHRFGIKTWVNYMTAAPDSTVEDDFSSIEFSRKHKASYSHACTTSPVQGTKLYEICRERNLLPPSFDEDLEQRLSTSPLTCFSQQEKDIRLNTVYLGALVTKLPWPLYQLGRWVIMHTKPKPFYRRIRDWFLEWSYQNIIFKH